MFPFSPWFNSIGFVKLFDYHKYSPFNTYGSDDETFIKMLVDDVNRTHNTIKIVESEDNMPLYDDARVVDAFDKAIERGVKIQFVLKPGVGEIE